jgi:hypothetical protein
MHGSRTFLFSSSSQKRLEKTKTPRFRTERGAGKATGEQRMSEIGYGFYGVVTGKKMGACAKTVPECSSPVTVCVESPSLGSHFGLPGYLPD